VKERDEWWENQGWRVANEEKGTNEEKERNEEKWARPPFSSSNIYGASLSIGIRGGLECSIRGSDTLSLFETRLG
jgi:hypothetical protein